jgi:hypothetical protein
MNGPSAGGELGPLEVVSQGSPKTRANNTVDCNASKTPIMVSRPTAPVRLRRPAAPPCRRAALEPWVGCAPLDGYPGKVVARACVGDLKRAGRRAATVHERREGRFKHAPAHRGFVAASRRFDIDAVSSSPLTLVPYSTISIASWYQLVPRRGTVLLENSHERHDQHGAPAL